MATGRVFGGPSPDYFIDCMTVTYDGVDQLRLEGLVYGPSLWLTIDLTYVLEETGTVLRSTDPTNDTGMISYPFAGINISASGALQGGFAAQLLGTGPGTAIFDCYWGGGGIAGALAQATCFPCE